MAEQLGGLTGLLDEEEGKDFTYNLFQSEAQDPDVGYNLQALYGTKSMPVFEWVKTIQTGERTYNPQDDFDNSMLDQLNQLESESQDGKIPGVPTTAEIVAGLATPVVQGVGPVSYTHLTLPTTSRV